jgi:hypothetical protein
MCSLFRNSRLAAFIVGCLAPAAFAVEDLATLFPEETFIFVSAGDIRTLEKLDEHAVVKTIATPEVKKAFASLTGKWEAAFEKMEKNWKEESGLEPEELRALFPGGAALGMAVQMDALAEAFGKPEGQRKVPYDAMEVVIAAQFAGDEAKAEKVIHAFMRAGFRPKEDGAQKAPAAFPDEYRYESADARGVKLHIWTPKDADTGRPWAWAIADKVLVFANGEKPLRQSLDRLQDGAPSLANSSGYKELASRFKENDLCGYMSLQQLLKKAFEVAAQRQENQNGSPIQFQSFIEAFGLDQIDSVYANLGTKKDALDVEFGLTFQEKPGFFKILATTGPGEVPAFLSPDHTNASYGTLDWAQSVAALETIIEKAAPPAKVMLDMQLDNVRKQTGVDVKKDFFGNLGPNYWSVSAIGEKNLSKALEDEQDPLAAANEDPQVIGFAIKNKKSFELALTSLLNLAAPGEGLLEKSNYQDYELNRFKPIPIPVVYVVTDDWLIISAGERSLLEKVLTNLKKGRRDDHLFAQPHVAASVRALPEGSHGTTYTDFGDMLNALAGIAKSLPDETLKEFVDVGALPDRLNIPLALSSAIYNEDRALRFRLHIEQKAQP